MRDSARWEQISEAGSQWTLDLVRFILRHGGRRFGVFICDLSSAFFVLRRGAARRASRRYLERLAARPGAHAQLQDGRIGMRHSFRHFREFALGLFDRMVVWSGALSTMNFEHEGTEALFDVATKDNGGLLLGAHVGSLDMMGFLAQENELKVNVVAFQQNAERINSFLESLGATNLHVIPLEPGSIQAAFEVRSCIQRREFVSMMADRLSPGSRERSAEIRFLGSNARFPLGPFELAGVLGCPVYVALCVRTGDRRYTTLLRPLAPARRVPRGEREKWSLELLRRYVEFLEETCERYPLQWFNFFDFWQEESG